MSILLTSGFPNFMVQEAHAVAGFTAQTTSPTQIIITWDVDDMDFGSIIDTDFEITLDDATVLTSVDFNVSFSDDTGPGPDFFDQTIINLLVITMPANDTPDVELLAGQSVTSGGGGSTLNGVVNVESTDGVVIPTVSSAATTSSTTVVLTMTKAMTNNAAIPGDFTIDGVASGPTVDILNVAGTSITLTLSAAIVDTDTPTVTYDGDADDLEDAPGNDLADFADQVVTNNVAAVVQTNNGGGNGCSGDCVHPTIGLDDNERRLVDNGFSYNNIAVDAVLFHTPFPLISAQIGETNTVSVKAWDNNGPGAIALVQFGLGVPEIGSPLNDAEVIIEVWISNTVVEKIVISDPHNLIENSAVTVQSELVDCRSGSDEQCVGITLKHVYREAPLYNVMSVEVMDTSRHVQSTTFNDGVEVLGESMNPADILNLVPNTTQNYPQTSGNVLLTQIDRAEQMWVDPYGYVWQGDKSKMTLISEIPFVRFQDSESEFTGYNSRLNSNFEMYKEEQIDGAQMVFDYLTSYKQIQGDDLTGYVAKTFDNVKLERSDDVELQQAIVDEQVRASVTFEQILDASFVPKN